MAGGGVVISQKRGAAGYELLGARLKRLEIAQWTIGGKPV